MDELRYPIGRFEPVERPAPAQRETWITDIAELPRALRIAVEHLTVRQLEVPYRPGSWNTRQVVHHLADNDMNAYIRFKRALTEEAPLAGSYREELWAELSDYAVVPIEVSLSLIESLHARFVPLLRSLQPADFERTFTSPTHGLMTLDVAIQRYAWHSKHHIAQIESLRRRNFES